MVFKRGGLISEVVLLVKWSLLYMEKGIFDSLWNKEGVVEIGTLRGETGRINRDSVNLTVTLAYEADKEFVVSYVDAYIVEGVIDYFGMEQENDEPTKHVPPTFTTPEEQKDWVFQTLGEFLDTYAFTHWSGMDRTKYVTEVTFQSKSWRCH